MKDFFKPQDFPDLLGLREQAAENANEKLNALIESCPVVYGNMLANTDMRWLDERNSFHTHTARILDIQKLPKQECKHEPDLLKMFQEYGLQNSKCKHCGIELRATWSPK